MQRHLLIVFVWLAALMLSPAMLSAQVIDISALPAKANLSPADEEQIKKFAEAQAKRLLEPQATEVKASRDLILRLLVDVKVTPEFRTRLTQALLPKLSAMVKEGDEFHAANALRIAGELATQSCIDLIKESLTDKRSSVRYAAAFAAARLYETFARTGAGPSAGAMKQLAVTLAGRIKSGPAAEADPKVLDGIVIAFSQALTIKTTLVKDEAFLESMLSLLATSMADRVGVLAGEDKAADKLSIVFRALGFLNAKAQELQLVLPGKSKGDILAFCSAILSAEPALKALKPDPSADAQALEMQRQALDQLLKAAVNLQKLLP